MGGGRWEIDGWERVEGGAEGYLGGAEAHCSLRLDLDRDALPLAREHLLTAPLDAHATQLACVASCAEARLPASSAGEEAEFEGDLQLGGERFVDSL